MIISEKQVFQLISVLYDSIKMNVSIPEMFWLSHEYRIKLYNDILQQQCEQPKEIKELE